MNYKEIKEPIYIFGEGEVCKYDLKDAESDIEAYDMEYYKAFDAGYRPLKLFKKDKYNRVGFILEDTEPKPELFIQEVKNYINTYNLDIDIDTFLKNIPKYPNC